MKQEPMSASIVIRAYNEEQHIGKLLEGIRAQSIQDIEIVLVDSGSTDRTVEVASTYSVKVIRIDPQDFSFGYSLNQGIEACTRDLVVIASAHVYPVYPDWLEQLIKSFANPKVAVAYGKQRGNEASKFSEQQLFRQWFPDGQPAPQQHPFCNNANAAIRKSLWHNLRYDESLPGLEDLDWANRVMQQGFTVQYVPDAEIIHVHQETPAGIYRRYLREGMAFKRIFPHEQFHLPDFLRLSVTNILADLKAAGGEKILKAHWRDIIWFRVMQFWGTYRGYQRSGPLTWQLKQRFYYPNLGKPLPQKSEARKIEPIAYNKQ